MVLPGWTSIKRNEDATVKKDRFVGRFSFQKPIVKAISNFS
jgi:hypothetical protein